MLTGELRKEGEKEKEGKEEIVGSGLGLAESSNARIYTFMWNN